MGPQLYTLKRDGKRLIFEEWHGEQRTQPERKATSRHKNAILELLKRSDPTPLGARDIALELGWSRATVHRRLTALKAERLIAVVHVQRGFGCRPFEVYRAVGA